MKVLVVNVKAFTPFVPFVPAGPVGPIGPGTCETISLPHLEQHEEGCGIDGIS